MKAQDTFQAAQTIAIKSARDLAALKGPTIPGIATLQAHLQNFANDLKLLDSRVETTAKYFISEFCKRGFKSYITSGEIAGNIKISPEQASNVLEYMADQGLIIKASANHYVVAANIFKKHASDPKFQFADRLLELGDGVTKAVTDIFVNSKGEHGANRKDLLAHVAYNPEVTEYWLTQIQSSSGFWFLSDSNSSHGKYFPDTQSLKKYGKGFQYDVTPGEVPYVRWRRREVFKTMCNLSRSYRDGIPFKCLLEACQTTISNSFSAGTLNSVLEDLTQRDAIWTEKQRTEKTNFNGYFVNQGTKV